MITGAPASGKSSLAHGLARALPGFALLQKDPVKEVLYEALTEMERRAPDCSRRLSDAAMRVLWAQASACPRVILEANFRTADPGERQKFQDLPGHKIEIHCQCPFEVATRRFAHRSPLRHPAHTLHRLSPALFEEFSRAFELAPLVELDTSVPVDVEAVAARLREHWPEL